MCCTAVGTVSWKVLVCRNEGKVTFHFSGNLAFPCGVHSHFSHFSKYRIYVVILLFLSHRFLVEKSFINDE